MLDSTRTMGRPSGPVTMAWRIRTGPSSITPMGERASPSSEARAASMSEV